VLGDRTADGAPIGVLPTNAVDHSAVTRPRNSGAAASWAVLLPVVMKNTLAAPATASSVTSNIAPTLTASPG
jgi:hypothetical protein